MTVLGVVGGSRISQHLLECNYCHHGQSLGLRLGLGLGACGAKLVPLPSVAIPDKTQRSRRRMVSSSSLQCKPPGDIPSLPDCFSQQEDNRELPVDGLSPVAGGIVALGKFDALHVGHRELAIQASRIGTPYMLSFVGIAEVLGWEPRAPIVAKCDRPRVLSSWGPHCGNMTPVEFHLEFSSVRHLSPREFVEKLSRELRVCGVVAGENYRFGYRAAGDASELVRLCKEYGIGAYIISSVMDKHRNYTEMTNIDAKEKGQVSSTRVRRALASGDMNYVTELLGRPHRLLLGFKDQDLLSSGGVGRFKGPFPKSCLLNLPPREGFYDGCSLLVGNKNPIKCRVFIDTTHIHLDFDEKDFCRLDSCQDFRLLGIEFGESS